MHFVELDAFDVTRGQLGWPWIAFAGDRRQLAYLEAERTIGTRILENEKVVPGPRFSLPDDLVLSAFALSSTAVLAVVGRVQSTHVVATLNADGAHRRTRVDSLLGPGHEVRAVAFDRRGRRLWLSTESANETVIALLDAGTLAVVGVHRSRAVPRPAVHELHLHPHDDAVLLLAASGEEGTFGRVVGFAGDVVSGVPTALDGGSIAAGFVGFSTDGMRVHLAEADELRTHAWPTLDELSSVPYDDDFVSSYSGAVLASDILVDGAHAESNEDAIMLFDRTGILGTLLPTAAPSGMWAGRFGTDAIVIVAAQGDPVRARVLVRKGTAKAMLS